MVYKPALMVSSPAENWLMNHGNAKRLRLVVLIFGLSVALGCVSSTEGRRMRRDIEALDARFAELSQSVSADRQQLSDLILTAEAEIQHLQAALDEAQSILRRSNTDLGTQLQAYSEEVQTLRGQMEQFEFRLNQLNEQLNLFMEDVDNRLSRRH